MPELRAQEKWRNVFTTPKMRQLLVVVVALFITAIGGQMGSAQPQSGSENIPVPTKLVEVTGQVVEVHAEDGKPCIAGKVCWIVATIGAGYNGIWSFSTFQPPQVKVGQLVRFAARIKADDSKLMDSADIAAHLPILASYKVVSPSTDAGARTAERHIREHSEAAYPGYKLLPDPDKPQPGSATAFLNDLAKRKGSKFRVPYQEGEQLLRQVVQSLSDSEVVNQIDLYETIGGYDGSTTSAGARKLRRLYVGKYYMLPGDVFHIQGDRDYPASGKSTFIAEGNVRLVGDTYVPVSVICFSATNVPQYRMAPILGRITDFRVESSQGGALIIVPVIKVVGVFASSNFRDDGEELIINRQ